MKISYRATIQVLSWGMILAGCWVVARAADKASTPGASRSVTFELTFANKDLVWNGDPASPNAQLYVKPGAKPIATDMYLTRLTESDAAPQRRYFRESRVATEGKDRIVYGFTSLCERAIGKIDEQNHFVPNEFYTKRRDLLPSWPADTSILIYDPRANLLYSEVTLPGPALTETLDFLPLDLNDAEGKPAGGTYAIAFIPSAALNGAGKTQPASVSLSLDRAGKSTVLARAILPRVFRRGDVEVGSYDNKHGTYVPESEYRAGAKGSQFADLGVTVSIPGELTAAVKSDGDALALADRSPAVEKAGAAQAKIKVDGNFDDWRNITGVDDPRGDLVPYLEYVADVDLLEFKVTNDDERIYLYARVAGHVGHLHPQGGRSYFYAYMDVDQNPGTGFLPSRDDDCYYGVDIGDDCEVQFEFVDNVFRKAFYGFCGLGGDENILKQTVTLGKSQYGRFADDGTERADYKTEYIYRNGKTEITEDLKLGDSDTIQVAVSPDGHKVEVASTLAGFLKDRNGKPTLALGQTIDLAAGMETDSKAYPGKTKWAADSTVPIRGYRLRSTAERAK